MSRWEDEMPEFNDVEFEFDPAIFDEYPPGRTFRSEGIGNSWWLAPLCAHQPQCVLKSTEAGWSVFAGAGADCISSMGRFDLLLNLTGESLFRRHVIPVPALTVWEGQEPASREIVLDWPDMGVVDLPRAFWVQLMEHVAQTKATLLVFCVGGHGRTGTAIASIMAVCGWASEDAIAWVRAHYCSRAIETDEQEGYVRWIAGEAPQLSRKPMRNRRGSIGSLL